MCCVKAWDFFTEAGSSQKQSRCEYLLHAILLKSFAEQGFLSCCLNINRPPQDSYILFVRVISPEDPCASRITELVGIPNLLRQLYQESVCTVSNGLPQTATKWNCGKSWEIDASKFKSRLSAQVIPWLSCYAIATVVSVAALFLKAKMFRDQIRRRRTEFVLGDEEQTDRIVKLTKHTKRSKSAGLQSALDECRV